MYGLQLPVLEATKRIGNYYLYTSRNFCNLGNFCNLSRFYESYLLCILVSQSVHLKLVANKRLMPLHPPFHPGWCARGRMMSLSALPFHRPDVLSIRVQSKKNTVDSVGFVGLA